MYCRLPFSSRLNMHVDASSSSQKFIKQHPPYGTWCSRMSQLVMNLSILMMFRKKLMINPPVSEKQELDVELAHSSDAANSDHDSSEDDNDSPGSYSEDEGSDEAKEFLVRNDLMDSKPPPTRNGQPPQVLSERSWLPGGYDPRRREPSYCNAG